MSKPSKKSVRANEFNQDKISAYLGVVAALDSPAAAASFRKAYPDHALSKPSRSRKQSRRKSR